jgi:hypothetical protein
MALRVNIPRVVLNRPDEYLFSKERFPKLKLLVIEWLFECFGDAGDSADGDTTQFLDIISQDVTELVIRDLTRYRGTLSIECEFNETYILRLAGSTLSSRGENGVGPTNAEDAVEIHEMAHWPYRPMPQADPKFAHLEVEVQDMRRSVTALSNPNIPPVWMLPPGHPPDERLNTIILLRARF